MDLQRSKLDAAVALAGPSAVLTKDAFRSAVNHMLTVRASAASAEFAAARARLDFLRSESE